MGQRINSALDLIVLEDVPDATPEIRPFYAKQDALYYKNVTEELRILDERDLATLSKVGVVWYQVRSNNNGVWTLQLPNDTFSLVLDVNATAMANSNSVSQATFTSVRSYSTGSTVFNGTTMDSKYNGGWTAGEGLQAKPNVDVSVRVEGIIGIGYNNALNEAAYV